MLKTYLKNLIKLIGITIACKNFWNFRLYRKYATDQNDRGALRIISTGRFAIVMQGPLIADSNFTIETLKLYRHNFPDAIIVLSAWFVGSNDIAKLKKCDVHIIQNTIPENHGISNINLQIVTSSAGVLAAREFGAQYVLKTRTDQRICHPSLETYLFNLVKTFPLEEGLSIQKNRLVAISLGTFKYRMYGVSDMFLYGHIDDMFRYWSVPLDTRKDLTEERNNEGDTTWRAFAILCICEVYLCTEFLKTMGRKINYSLADSFRVFRDHFVVIDQAAIKLYWHKYTLNADRYANMRFFDPELSFNDWLVLYHSIENMTIDESILDQPIVKVERNT